MVRATAILNLKKERRPLMNNNFKQCTTIENKIDEINIKTLKTIVNTIHETQLKLCSRTRKREDMLT